VRRDQALEVVAGQAPVDAVTERRGRSIKISPDQGAPYAAEPDVHLDGRRCINIRSVSAGSRTPGPASYAKLV